jgi:hypothetical protein
MSRSSIAFRGLSPPRPPFGRGSMSIVCKCSILHRKKRTSEKGLFAADRGEGAPRSVRRPPHPLQHGPRGVRQAPRPRQAMPRNVRRGPRRLRRVPRSVRQGPARLRSMPRTVRHGPHARRHPPHPRGCVPQAPRRSLSERKRVLDTLASALEGRRLTLVRRDWTFSALAALLVGACGGHVADEAGPADGGWRDSARRTARHATPA